MVIKGYLPTSLLEWPGKISAVVFVSGCNFRCPFCHNRDLVLSPGKLDSIAEEEILNNLRERKKWVDGVAVTGGEPTLDPGLTSFLRKVKKLGLLAMVETNGSQPQVIKKLLKSRLVERWTMDVKASLTEESYRRASGIKADLKAIKKSIALLSSSGLAVEFRTTVVPGIHSQKNLERLAKELQKILTRSSSGKTTPQWVLQQFEPQNCLDPAFNKVKSYSPRVLKEILTAVREHFPQTELRGVDLD